MLIQQQPTAAVQARLNELLDRQAEYVANLAGYRLDRAILEARIEKLAGAERQMATEQLQIFESQTGVNTARLAETRRNIAELRTPAAGTIVEPSVTRMFGLTEAEFIGGGTFLLLLPMAIAMAQAIEVERIGESQRFASRLLAEQQPAAPPPVRQESAPRPVITPRP